MCIFMCIFGEIVEGVMHLNEAGHIVAWTWQDLSNHVPNGILDAFVVMPNHVHGTIIITSRTPVGAGSEPAPTGMRDVIMMVPCTWFGMTTNASHIPFGTWLGRSCQVHATI